LVDKLTRDPTASPFLLTDLFFTIVVAVWIVTVGEALGRRGWRYPAFLAVAALSVGLLSVLGVASRKEASQTVTIVGVFNTLEWVACVAAMCLVDRIASWSSRKATTGEVVAETELTETVTT